MVIVHVVGIGVPIIEDGSGTKGSSGFGDRSRRNRFEAATKGEQSCDEQEAHRKVHGGLRLFLSKSCRKTLRFNNYDTGLTRVREDSGLAGQ